MKKTIFKIIKKYNSTRNFTLNKLSSPIVVLMYHRVHHRDDITGPYTVSTKNFQEQMLYLKENFNLLRFEDDWSDVKGTSFVITFDDGYYDNYLIARDFLEPEEIPATFFITTQNIDNNNFFWWDNLNLNLKFFENKTGLEASKLFKLLKNSTRKEQLDFFKKYNFTPCSNTSFYDFFRSMSKDELLNLEKLKISTIGAHTINHIKLPLLSRDEIFFELNESKKSIEGIIGKPVTTCSFPYGSYNKKVINSCEKIGFEKAAATGESRNSYCWSNPLKIPRVLVENIELEAFKEQISKLLI